MALQFLTGIGAGFLMFTPEGKKIVKGYVKLIDKAIKKGKETLDEAKKTETLEVVEDEKDQTLY